MKKIALSVTGLMIMSIGICAETSVSVADAFKNGTLSGQIRAGYLYVDPEHSTLPNNYTTAVGGQLKYETGAYHGFSLGAAFYTSHALLGLSGDREEGKFNEEMADTSHYDILAESYLNYRYDNFNLRIGRQRVDTPYADSDDIRMTPNTFEGAVASYRWDDITLMGAWLTKWQGPDAAYAFEDLVEGENGVAMLAATYSKDDLEGGLWYYHADATADIFYGDIADTYRFNDDLSLKGALQAAHQHEIDRSGIEATLLGAMAELAYRGLTLGIAYDKVLVDEDKAYFGGFGGGVGFVNMFEMTAGVISVHQDVEAWKGTVCYDFSQAGIEGLSVEYDYGHFKGDARHEADEHNFILAYAPSKSWDLEMVYDRIDDKHKDLLEDDQTHAHLDYSLSRVLVRANYNF